MADGGGPHPPTPEDWDEVPPEDDGDDPCPVVPIAYRDGRYWFLSPSGEMRIMSQAALKGDGLIFLFNGDISWLIRRFQRHDRDGQPVQDFNTRLALSWLIRRATAAGVFDPGMSLRGHGVWKVNGVPAPVVHCGDAIFVDGKSRPPGLRIGIDVFPRRSRAVRPTFTDPATVDDGVELRRLLGLWRYEADGDQDLLLGWIGLAMLGGWSRWRTHLLVSAQTGSGKSALASLIFSVLGAGSFEFNDFTEPGIRAAMLDEARTPILDEAENTGTGAESVARVVALVRKMSSGRGAQIARGAGLEGGAATGTAVGCAALLSVNPPPFLPADATRFLRLELIRATDDPDAQARVDAARAWGAARSPQLRARMLGRWRDYEEAWAVWRLALVGVGCNGRMADMLASLLAARDVLLFDVPRQVVTGDTLLSLAPRIAAMRADDAEMGDGRRCLNTLMGHTIKHWISGRLMSLGEMVAKAFSEDNDKDEFSHALRTHGLAIDRADPQAPALLIANSHRALEALFHDTTWASGGWAHSRGPARLPGREKDATPGSVHGVRSRAVRIPKTVLDGDEPSGGA